MPRKPKDVPLLDPNVSVLCMQCDEQLVPMLKPRLYCGMACQQEAEIIRYVRGCAVDGRIDQPDVQLAIKIRMAHTLSGGHDRKARKLSKEQRLEVVAQSDGLCTQCGEPGVEIDHIEGPSSNPKNLQLLCKDCHNSKTLLNIVAIDPQSDDIHPDMKIAFERIMDAAKAMAPQRPCHDEVSWRFKWRNYRKERAFFVLPRR